MLFLDELKDALQNLSGKTVTGTFETTAEMLHAFNHYYLCVVTFTITPDTAILVLKKAGVVVAPNEDGTYSLNEGSYTYGVTADGYTTIVDEALVISNSDEATGTKAVTVEMETCVVTFALTPSDATVVVKEDGVTITAVSAKVYNLIAGSYTYSVTKAGYIQEEDVALTISAGDVTTGTKTVTVSLVKYCVVTFAPIDSVTTDPITGATVVVYDSESETVVAEVDGTYILIAASYTFDISAEGYVAQTGVSLTISAEDVTTGTKSVATQLVADES